LSAIRPDAEDDLPPEGEGAAPADEEEDVAQPERRSAAATNSFDSSLIVSSLGG
jgi:hypothetical protein